MARQIVLDYNNVYSPHLVFRLTGSWLGVRSHPSATIQTRSHAVNFPAMDASVSDRTCRTLVK